MTDEILHIGLLEDEAIHLDAGALQIAALDHPDADLDPYLDLLNAMTERLAVVGIDARTGSAQAGALASVIGGEYGFGGDSLTYDDPDNADLIRVIDRRRGLPVALSILYVSQARRLGWSADVLGTPGHVLVRVGPETQPVLIDPFAGGNKIGPEDLRNLLQRMLGKDARPAPEHVAAMSNRAVLVRLLMNQATRAEHGGDAARALEVYTRMTVISPSLPHGWWERARLELADSNVPAARASLSAMLEITRDATLRAHIYSALDTLSGNGSA